MHPNNYYSTAHEQLNALVRESREFSCRLSRDESATLARTLGYTRENTWLHSREHLATLARTLGYTRKNIWLHSREHLATHARPIGYSNTREATWLARLHSRGHCIDEADIIMGATQRGVARHFLNPMCTIICACCFRIVRACIES